MLWHVLLSLVACWAPSALLKILQQLYGPMWPWEAAYNVPAGRPRPSVMSHVQHSACRWVFAQDAEAFVASPAQGLRCPSRYMGPEM